MSEWRPILDGERAAHACAVIDDLVAALAAWEPEPVDLPHAGAGAALLLAYYGEAFGREDIAARADELLVRGIEQLAERPLRPALHGGYAGLGWAVEHLAGADPDDPDDPNTIVDGAIAGVLAGDHDEIDYDLVSGLVGLAVYALERLPRPSAAASLERIVAVLERGAEERDGGLTWHTPPALLPGWQREMAPDGYYNLGLAHGVPGVVGVLGRIVAAGIATRPARRLLDGAVGWLLAQAIEGQDASFASWLDGIEREPCRTAWCYGDPGVAAGLMRAAMAVDQPSWAETAHRLAAAAAVRAERRCGVFDAGLCHGSLGLAHLFNRFYQATGDETFRAAARRWIDDGLARRRPGQGIAGFQAFVPGSSGTHRWDPEPGFLTGAAGIGLALLAACTDLVPDWDRVMLVDLPPATGS